MRKFIYMMILLFVSVLSLTSCHTRCETVDVTQDENDSAVSVQAESFETIGDVLVFHEHVVNAYVEDSIFRAMPWETVRNVCEVLNHYNEELTISNIVGEYQRCSDVYDSVYRGRNIEAYEKLNIEPDSVENYDNTKPRSKTLSESDKAISNLLQNLPTI